MAHPDEGAAQPIRGDGEEFLVNLVLDTSLHAAGELLFDMTEIPLAVRANGDVAFVKSVTVIDGDSQGMAMDIYIGAAGTTLGTKNAAPTISDTNVIANRLKAVCSIGAGDYKTLSGAKIATRDDLSLMAQAGASSRSLWIGGVTQGTPTHGVNGITLLVGLVWK